MTSAVSESFCLYSVLLDALKNSWDFESITLRVKLSPHDRTRIIITAMCPVIVHPDNRNIILVRDTIARWFEDHGLNTIRTGDSCQIMMGYHLFSDNRKVEFTLGPFVNARFI